MNKTRGIYLIKKSRIVNSTLLALELPEILNMFFKNIAHENFYLKLFFLFD